MQYFLLQSSLGDKIQRFIENDLMFFVRNILIALIIFYVGKWVANKLADLCAKLMTASKMDETLVKFLRTLAYIGLMVVVAIAAIGRLGVETTSFAAILAAAGLAVGMALKDTLGNFASGVMIIMFKPYKVGDLVEIAGTTGVVEEVTIFNTMMKTGDNVQMYIPNGSVTGGKISNYSTKPHRRIDLVIGCGYDDDLKAVKAYIEEVVNNHDQVLKDPAPTVAVAELGDNSVNFVVRPWVNNADYWGVRFDLIEKIKIGFDEKGFNFPYPQTDVHLHKVD
jgi:small conductance mechanosensitive channel